MVASIEASFLERTGRASIQKKALSFSELLIKLIEPTFSEQRNQIFMCAQKMKRKVKGISLWEEVSSSCCLTLPVSPPPCPWHPHFLWKKNLS